MTTSQKAAISLLIAVLLFGGFLVLVYTGALAPLEASLLDLPANQGLFLPPTIFGIILLAALFLTVFLVIFLLFNIRQDPLVIVQNRLKLLQISIIEQFYDRKGDADWVRWIRELESRREEIRSLLKRGIRADLIANSGVNGKKSEVMDILINRSWDELLAMLGSRRAAANPQEIEISEDKIAKVLQKLLDARAGAALQSSSLANLSIKGEAGVVDEEKEKTEPIPVNNSINPSNDEEIETLEELSMAEDPKDVSLAETVDEDLFNGELEIVSPFSEMVFDSSPTGDLGAAEEGEKDGPKEGRDDEAVKDANEGLPLVTTLFSSVPGGASIETLEVFDAEKETDDGVIREKEGVHYISEDALAPSPKFASTLNPEFKGLVDEVTNHRIKLLGFTVTPFL